MADFDFGDWFDVDENTVYHRLSFPNNIFAKDMGLYSFSSGELFEVLKREKNICIKGKEYALKMPRFYTDEFAEGTVHAILQNARSPHFLTLHADASKVKLDSWTNLLITKKLTSYGNEIHGGSGIAGVIQSHSELVTLPSGGALPNDPAYQAKLKNRADFASEVIRSPSGLYTNIELSYRFGTSGVDGADCIKSQNTLVTCMLYGFDYLASVKRNIAIKGQGTDGPMINAAPSTVYGKAGIPKLDVPGTFESIAEGGLDNPKNTVAAPISMHFEQNTGKFESGTKQLVAMLLTDLKGVVNPSLSASDFHLLKLDDLFDSQSSSYIGAHELAEAMPIGVKGSNPNIYGPDKKASGPCDEGEIKETITVVNRSQEPYSKGERVLVGWIGGEWLVIKSMEGAEVGDGFEIQGWTDIFNMIGLRQHMHNQVGMLSPVEDDYFDVTNRRELINRQDASPRIWNPHRDPAVAEEGFLRSFYDSLQINPTQSYHYAISDPIWLDLNLKSLQINVGSAAEYDPGYAYQYTQFDMLHPQLGGANSMGNMIANCHQYESTLGAPFNVKETISMGAKPFAGMSFPEGYEAGKLGALKFWADKGQLQASGAGTYAYNYFGGNYVANVFDLWDINQIFDTGRTPELGGTGVNRHVNAIFESKNNTHIPAEVALNGSIASKGACPIQSLSLLRWATDYPISSVANVFPNGRTRDDFAANIVEYRKHRYHWLEHCTDGEPAGDLWNLKPRNPNHVTFIPMMAEVATHLDSPHQLHWDKTMDFDVYRNLGGNAKSVPNHPVPLNFQALQNGTNNSPPSDGTPASSKLNMFGDLFYGREIVGRAFGRNSIYIHPGPSFELPSNSFEYLAQTHDTALPGTTARTVHTAPIKTYPYNLVTTQGDGSYFRAALINPNWQSNLINNNNVNHRVNFGRGSYISHISTAKVRVQTNAAAIEFTTDQLLGVNFETTLTSPDVPVPQWGRTTDDIGTYNTSALHARIVDAWPEHLTVFDPRCMAVHHFQPGDPTAKPRGLWYKGGRPAIHNGEVFEDATLLPANAVFGYSTEQFGDTFYQVDERSGSVDFRVPTTATAGRGVILPLGAQIDSSSPIRKKQDWRINSIRRGMAKPFNFYKRTIGFSKDDIEIISAGSGYVPNDVLKGYGGQGQDAWLKVKAIDMNGGITEAVPFDISYGDVDENGNPEDNRTVQESIGYGFSHEDFSAVSGTCDLPFFTSKSACLDAGGTWTPVGGSKLRFSNYAGGDERLDASPTLFKTEGTGADIGVAQGIVWDKLIIDFGQTKRQVELLSLPSKEGKNTEDGNRGLALGVRQKAVNIPDPVGIYDIYYYFHADPSYYTFNEDSQTPNWLNYCDLRFAPTATVADPPVPTAKQKRIANLKKLMKYKGFAGRIIGGLAILMNADLLLPDDETPKDPPTEE